MSFHGYDPGDRNNWYQSPQLGLFPSSAVYGGGISGACYSTHSSHPHGSPSYPPPPSQFPLQPSYPPPPPPSQTTVNGYVFPHQFPHLHANHAQWRANAHSPHNYSSTGLLSTTPQSPLTPIPPHPSEIYHHYPPTQPYFIPTNQFIPPAFPHEQPRPISDLKQVEPAPQLRPIPMEPDWVRDWEAPIVDSGYSFFTPELTVKLKETKKAPSPPRGSGELQVHKNITDAKLCEMQESLKSSMDTFISKFKEELRLLWGSSQSPASQVDNPLNSGSPLPTSTPKLIPAATVASSSLIPADNSIIRKTPVDSGLNLSHTDVILGFNDNTSMDNVVGFVCGAKLNGIDEKLDNGDGREFNELEGVTPGANPYSIKKGIGKTVLAVVNELENKSRLVKGCDDVKAVTSMSAGNDEQFRTMIVAAIDKAGQKPKEKQDISVPLIKDVSILVESTKLLVPGAEDLATILHSNSNGSYHESDSGYQLHSPTSDEAESSKGRDLALDGLWDDSGGLPTMKIKFKSFCKPGLVLGDFELIHEEDHMLEDHEQSAVVTHSPQLCQKAGVKVRMVTGDLLMLGQPLHLKLNNGDNFNVTVLENFKCKSCDGDLVGVVEDSQFYNFKKDKRSSAKGQVWAICDDDGMLRNYGLVDKVFDVSPFEVELSWLDLQNNGDQWLASWEKMGLHVPCGRFKVTKQTTTNSVHIISHVVDCDRAARELYLIYPKKGFVWVLYNEAAFDADGRNMLVNETRGYDIVVFLTSYSEMYGLNMGYLDVISAIKTYLSDTIEPWLDGIYSGNGFLHDSKWGGIVTKKGSEDSEANFGFGIYNDHCYHLGYFIYAISVLSMIDLAWGRKYRPQAYSLNRKPNFQQGCSYCGIVHVTLKKVFNFSSEMYCFSLTTAIFNVGIETMVQPFSCDWGFQIHQLGPPLMMMRYFSLPLSPLDNDDFKSALLTTGATGGNPYLFDLAVLHFLCQTKYICHPWRFFVNEVIDFVKSNSKLSFLRYSSDLLLSRDNCVDFVTDMHKFFQYTVGRVHNNELCMATCSATFYHPFHALVKKLFLSSPMVAIHSLQPLLVDILREDAQFISGIMMVVSMNELMVLKSKKQGLEIGYGDIDNGNYCSSMRCSLYFFDFIPTWFLEFVFVANDFGDLPLVPQIHFSVHMRSNEALLLILLSAMMHSQTMEFVISSNLLHREALRVFSNMQHSYHRRSNYDSHVSVHLCALLYTWQVTTDDGYSRLDYKLGGDLMTMANESVLVLYTGLDWNTRFSIALGTAKGLANLHEECEEKNVLAENEMKIVHGRSIGKQSCYYLQGDFVSFYISASISIISEGYLEFGILLHYANSYSTFLQCNPCSSFKISEFFRQGILYKNLPLLAAATHALFTRKKLMLTGYYYTNTLGHHTDGSSYNLHLQCFLPRHEDMPSFKGAGLLGSKLVRWAMYWAHVAYIYLGLIIVWVSGSGHHVNGSLGIVSCFVI